MLSLYKLEIFASVVREGSFSAAAQSLYMTQPAVSQHIQDLEEMLGTRLFDRKRRGVHLTASGETLHQYTERILRLVAEAEAAVTDVDQLSAGQLTLAATPGISLYLLPAWTTAFRMKYPNLGVAVNTAITGQVVGDVLGHRADVGFVEGDISTSERDLGIRVLGTIEMFLVVNERHAWSTLDHIQIEMLNDQPMLTREPMSRTRIWLDGILARHGVKPRIVGEFDSPSAIKHAVMNGSCIGVLPDYAIQQETKNGLLHALKIDGVQLQRQMSLVWDMRQPVSAVARAFLQHMAESYPQLKNLAHG